MPGLAATTPASRPGTFRRIGDFVTLTERLERRLLLTDTGCLEWQGYRMTRGYGQIGDSGRVRLTHVVAWSIANGRQPRAGMFICHTCDNPSCCNPRHLYEGTHRDNMRDMKGRGRARGARGQASPFAKLTAEQVAEIRARYRPGGHPARRKGSTAKELSDEFGISKQYVRDLAANKWRQHGV